MPCSTCFACSTVNHKLAEPCAHTCESASVANKVLHMGATVIHTAIHQSLERRTNCQKQLATFTLATSMSQAEAWLQGATYVLPAKRHEPSVWSETNSNATLH